MAGADPGRHLTVGEVPHRHVAEQGDRHVDLRDLDAAGAAGHQPGQDADHREDPGAEVGDRDAGLAGWAPLEPGEVHVSGQGLHEQVLRPRIGDGPAPGVAEGADRAVDDLLQDGAFRAGAAPGAVLVDDDVGPAHQACEGTGPGVGRHRALAPVERQPCGVVRLSAGLDLDDVRTEVGQDRGGERTRAVGADLQHADPVQRGLPGVAHSAPSWA